MKYKRIMIIDDSVTSRMIIKKCFMIAGYREADFIEAENGLHALTILEESSVDLIVTDLNMPKMDGNSLVKKLNAREESRQIPVLVITSLGNEVTQNDLMKQGVIAVIKKPLCPESLSHILGGDT